MSGYDKKIYFYKTYIVSSDTQISELVKADCAEIVEIVSNKGNVYKVYLKQILPGKIIIKGER